MVHPRVEEVPPDTYYTAAAHSVPTPHFHPLHYSEQPPILRSRFCPQWGARAIQQLQSLSRLDWRTHRSNNPTKSIDLMID